MNANELKVLEDALQVIETLQAEIESLKSGFFDWSGLKSVTKVNNEFNSRQENARK